MIVCCETYKFSERVQTDSILFNELGKLLNIIATGLVSNFVGQPVQCIKFFDCCQTGFVMNFNDLKF